MKEIFFRQKPKTELHIRLIPSKFGKPLVCDMRPEFFELMRRRAEFVLDARRPDEESMKGIINIDSDSAVQMLARIGRKLAALGRPIFGDSHGL